MGKFPKIWFWDIFTLEPALCISNLLKTGICEKYLVRSTHHVSTLLTQRGLALSHLVPDTAKCIVGKKAHDIAWCIELIAKSQFRGVAWDLTLVTCLIAQLFRREILVYPSYSFIF